MITAPQISADQFMVYRVTVAVEGQKLKNMAIAE